MSEEKPVTVTNTIDEKKVNIGTNYNEVNAILFEEANAAPSTFIERNASVNSLTALEELDKDPVASTSKQASIQTVKPIVNADFPNDNNNEDELNDRSCWICFATDEDNRLAAWVQPCKCRGTTKWVHQSCLYRWVDEKQKGNALRSVSCQQCQTDYIIVFPHMGKIANLLEALDNLIKRMCPFLAAGIFVGSLYWTAVTYGAVTFLQLVGHKKGMALMENGDPLVLLIGLPAIPVGLVLGRMIRWEDAVIKLIRNRHNVARKLPLMNFFLPYANDEEEEQNSIAQNPATPTLADPISATRVFCGALLLPTISCIVGRFLFDSIENNLHRTLLGGLTFITVKGILKIYLKQQQYTRKTKRKIVDYNEDNVRHYMNRSSTSSRHHAANAAIQQQEQQQHAAAATNQVQDATTVTSHSSRGSIV